MKHNHNSARCLVRRVSFRGISLILALGLLLESCHGTDHPLVPGSKIHQDTKVKLPIKQRGSREEILQEQEDQLLDKAFKTRQGYIVKFYKEEGLWRANIVEEIGIFRNEFDLPAYLGEDEDLAENIERLLFNVDKFDQVKTKLIQVVFSSKEREGYVCIEGGWGGMKKQGSDKKTKEEEGGEKEKGESSKVLPQATPKKKKRKRRKSSLASGVSITLPMTLPSTPIQSPTKKPKIQEESSKNKGKEIIEVGKETGSQEVSQPSPKKKKRKRKRRSSLSLVTSPTTTSTPAHSPAKKLKEESESTKVSHTFKKYTIKGSEKKSEGKGKEKMTQEDEEKRLNEDPEFQLRQGKQAYCAWRYEGKNSDRNEALKWLRRAEAQGHERARKLLEKLERKTIGLKDDQERHIKQGIKKKTIFSGAGSSMLQGKMKKLVVPTSKGKTRTGFRDKGWFTNEALNAQLPVGYQLGAAYDDGDCFFDALAQCLNRIQNTTKHTVKSLREACHKFYQKNQKLVADWDLADRKENTQGEDRYEKHEYYYSKIQYTADECASLFNKDICIWGRPWVEGIMICGELKLNVICSIEVLKDPDTANPVVSYHSVDKDVYKSSIIEDQGEALVKQGNIPVLVNIQDKFHFVPLLKELEIGKGLEESEEELPQLLVESSLEYERNLLETSASSSTPPTKVKEKPRHESPDKSRKLEDKVKISEEQYKLAEKLAEEYRASKKADSKTKILLQKAIGLYKKAAKKDHKKAQKKLVELRDKGLCSNPDQEAMAWYKQAVETAIASELEWNKTKPKSSKPKPNANLTFAEFQNKAKERMRDYVNNIERIKVVRVQSGCKEPSWRGPLRISDLIVMDLNPKKVPAYIEWGGDYASPGEANADHIFGPLFELPDTEKYEDAVLAIDPSAQGRDETAYCVAKRYGDYYFITAVGGLGGRYNDEDSKASVGNSPTVLDELIFTAMKHNVSRLRIEINKEYSFADLIKFRFGELKSREKFAEGLEKKVFEFNLRHQTQGKQGKILGTLRPLLSEHRLIIDRQALRSDFESVPIEDLSYKFFYQLMTIVENKKTSKKYFDGNNPAHDDRVDVVVDAIRYLQERKDKRAKFDTILKELQDKAEKGDGEAQLELGKRYKDGLGVEADLKKAQEWLSKAADQGNAEALYNLGEIYRNGLGVNIKEDLAFKFYQMAAKRAYAPAEYILAKMYQEGFGKLPKKLTQAKIFRLFSGAAENGHSEAAYELGKLYQSGLGEIKKDLYKAFTQYEKAAKLGHAAAAYVLAKMCQNGFEEIKMDPAQAFKWYLIAAENGHQEAQLEVADKYYEGREVDRNYQQSGKRVVLLPPTPLGTQHASFPALRSSLFEPSLVID